MSLDNLTAEEMKILATGKLLAYCDDTITLEPPSHADCISELYCSFSQTGFRRSGETHLEKMRDDFPNIDENELMDLIAYFKQAENYCDRVCSAYAMKHPYNPVSIGSTQEEREDVGLVVRACRQRFPWLTQDHLEMHLKGVVAMCIR